MVLRILAARLAILVWLAARHLSAAEYAIDPDHSNVRFSVPVLGVSKITGKLMRYDVKIAAGKALDLSRASATAVIEIVKSVKGRWEAVGPLTLHGVTREITLPFTIQGKFDGPKLDELLGVHPSFAFDRREFGMAWEDNPEAKVVGNQVNVDVTLAARRMKKKS